MSPRAKASGWCQPRGRPWDCWGVATVDEGRSNRDRLAEAWTDLGPDLVRFASSQVGPHQADDVVSAAMVGLLRQPVLPTGDELRPYLFRSVANQSAKHWRTLGRRQRREALAAPDRSSPPQHTPDQPAGPDPEVLQALADLSPQQRAAVHLFYWEELPVAEIADHLGIGTGSVKQHLHRARCRLATTLEPGPNDRDRDRPEQTRRRA